MGTFYAEKNRLGNLTRQKQEGRWRLHRPRTCCARRRLHFVAFLLRRDCFDGPEKAVRFVLNAGSEKERIVAC